MASRIAITGDANTGKSWSRRYLDGTQTFLLQPSVKAPYLFIPNGKEIPADPNEDEREPVKDFSYKGASWEKTYELPSMRESGVSTPTQAISQLSAMFHANAAKEGKEEVLSKLSPDKNLMGNVQLINKSLVEAREWLRFISDWMPWIKTVIVADFTHFISNVIASKEFINRKIGGEAYQRFWELAADALNTFLLSTDDLRKDLIVVIEFHTVWDKDRMRYELYTPAGNMLTEKFKPESYFDVMLFTDVMSIPLPDGSEKTDYRFVTKRTAQYPQARSGNIFQETFIPNNLQTVIERYRKVNLKEK